jgi:hypothetical protein
MSLVVSPRALDRFALQFLFARSGENLLVRLPHSLDAARRVRGAYNIRRRQYSSLNFSAGRRSTSIRPAQSIPVDGPARANSNSSELQQRAE